MLTHFAAASLPADWWDSFSNVSALFRLILGATLAAHGYKKFFLGGKIAGTARWFDSMGMKPNGTIHAYLAACTELVCGFLMIVGLLTPFAAAGYVSVMLVAAWTVHRSSGYWSDNGWEYTSILASSAVFAAAVGPGKHSLDWALGFDFAFNPLTAFAIALGLGLAGGIGLLVCCYRPPAPTDA